MRGLAKIMALVLLPLAGLAACDRESDAAPSAAYDTSAASNAKFLADYAARADVKKTSYIGRIICPPAALRRHPGRNRTDCQ